MTTPQFSEPTIIEQEFQYEDWDLSPDVRVFYGREKEQETLKKWIQTSLCKLVTIVGSSGVGKTVLASKLFKDLQDEFEYAIWCSLDSKPSFNQLIKEIIKFFSKQPDISLTDDNSLLLAQLVRYLKEHRCLIILDDWQSILEEQDYQLYRELLQRIGSVYHQSCLMIISSEKPEEIDLLESDAVRCLSLNGLGEAAKEILRDKGLSDEHLWNELIALYRGNPLVLKKVATTINNVFDGSVEAFFGQQTLLGVVVHEDLKEKLNEQLQRLSELEQQILRTLATSDQPMSQEQLRERLNPDLYVSHITKALESLSRKSLIDRATVENKLCWTLQPMVKKHIIREYEQRLQIVVRQNESLVAEPSHSLSTIEQSESALAPLENDFIPSMQDDECLPPIAGWTKLAGLVMAASVGLAIFLSAVIPYNVTVKAEAKVRPAGELPIVEAEIEGTVKEILVEDNQQVKKGQSLIILDDSTLQTKKQQVNSDQNQLKIQESQIDSQINTQETQINAEKQRYNTLVASAEEEYQGQIENYDESKKTTQAQIEEAEANLRQAEKNRQKAQSELSVLQANLREAQATLEKAKAKQARYQQFAEDGVLPKDELDKADLDVIQQEEAVNRAKVAIETQLQQIEILKESEEVAKAKLAATQADTPSQSAMAIAKKRIDEQKAALASTLAALEREKESLLQQKTEIEKQIASNKHDLQQIERELQKTIVTAPTDGTLNSKTLRNAGQTVRPGEAIFTIVPSQAPLVIKAAVANQDKNYLEVGQEVHMRVEACPYPDYGTLKGKVSQISEDTNTASSPTESPTMYEVTIEPASNTLNQGNNECTIEPGMQGSVDIIAKEETLLQFVLRKARLSADL